MNNSKIFRRRGLFLSAAILTALWGAAGAGCGDRDDVAEAPASSTTVIASTPDSQTRVTTVTTEQGSQRSSGSGNIEDGVPVDNENTNAGPGGATGTEVEIADEINKKIIRNPQMTGSRVNVVVDTGGMATLSGFTQNQQQKALALKAAKETAGVLDVKDKLEIRPTGGTGKTPKPAPQPQTTIVVVPQAGSSTGQNQSTQPKPEPKFSPETGESEEPSEGGTTEGETGSGGARSGERLPGTPVGVGPDSGRN